ncbi:lipoprotein [Streptomyces davaonensis JCM 4913]|uniref:Lipoprotein n=1 Tax=Streptomyces davaonensis (strain DSM 101723 / JCM 4913 / KCC S-0913 / 768) TaxID=1214101 RepID=K4QZS3_STRDJ|nr:HNH endonuclease family protein [Streptomyces davaonensis]CCK29551.1 lipoprotein [Streptomyces davaonensis JCM 4913]
MRLRGGAAACAAVLGMALVLTGCEDMGDLPLDGSASGSAPGSGTGRAVSPLDNPDGTEPGLAAITSDADRAEARALIEKVATKGRGPRTGYDRDEFGYAWMDSAPGGIPYARNGCDTRNDLLRRDGAELRFRSGSDCVVMSMRLDDPYTGRTIEWTKARAIEVQIDHVMPLSYDWQMGASRWTEGERQAIANDPLNLMPVDGPTNSSKGDSGPASWLPPNKRIRCSYAVRFAQVSLKYELPVTAPDKQMMLRQCGG